MLFKKKQWHIDDPGGPYPCVVLRGDNWDDFGFKTTFNICFWMGRGNSLDLGQTKILRRGTFDTRDYLDEPFERLDPGQYCSIGQDLDYYRSLLELDAATRMDFLERLCDVTVLPDATAWREQDLGYETSILRFSGAIQALAEARYELGLEERQRRTVRFTYTTQMPGASQPHLLKFDFDEGGELPRRAAVIVGRNGTGKTTVLRNLSATIGGWGLRQGDEWLQPNDVGILEPPRPAVG